MSIVAVTENRFPDLLRSWRKLRKLSQWDLAMNAGISQRHLSFLESGRSCPSREMVLKIASTLEIPLGERNNLLGSAGFAPVYSESRLDDASLANARSALEMMLNHHEPYPCLVVDRNWNMILSNEANLKLFSQFINPLTVWSDIGDPGSQNLVRLILHPRGLKPFVRNWDSFARYFLYGLRQELRSNPWAVETSSLLEEVSGYPDVPGMDETLPIDHSLPFLTMELTSDDFNVKLFSMVTTFGSPHDVTLQQLRIETFFPADEDSKTLIRQLENRSLPDQ
jgi:transcriptional regulator with XRE-family HTH domain